MKLLAKNLLLLMVLAAVLGYLGNRFRDLSKGTDFVQFYSAARMLQEGAGHRLYDFALQEHFQARYGGRIGTYFVHPPFEALLYFPFALLPLSTAYILWSAVNIVLLLSTAKLLQEHLFPGWDWRAIGLIFISFLPVLVTLMQGQDTILLLFLFVAAFAALRNKAEFAAGCLVAGGLFKFHLALPLFLMIIPGKTRRFAAGFISIAALLGLVSVAISGWGVLVDYPRCLLHFQQIPLAAIHPREEMANLRGLAALLLPSGARLTPWLTLAGSLVIVWIGIKGWIGDRSLTHNNLALANAITGATLVGYHQSPCDLTLLLLPLALLVAVLRSKPKMPQPARATWMGLELLLFLPPLHLLLLDYHRYSYAAVPLILLFAMTYADIRRCASAPLNR